MKQTIEINESIFEFEYEEEARIAFSKKSEENGIAVYHVCFDWGELTSPTPITLSYEIPATDLYYMWDAIHPQRNLSFSYRATESRLPWGMPLKSLVSRNGNNAYLVALSDVKTPLSIRMRCNNERPTVTVSIDFFTMLCGPFSHYETELRIDCRKIAFDEAIYGARKWFDALGYQNGYVPDAALRPMYSTWYSYTKSIDTESILAECREAVRYGMDTVIVDDGWQTGRYDSMYGNCGDWNPAPEKFPDMKAFTDAIHALGMKAMLWYATPFMGEFAQKYEEFQAMCLEYSSKMSTYFLDPRYREVRSFLIETFSHAVRDWGFDGLKLDFIDRFKTNGEYNEIMDTVSVEDATERLLSEVSDALKAINPNVLIEFRQPYFGPVVSTYGNMMRVWDCPLDGARNRVQSLNLRLVCGGCAVHSDMIVWNAADTPENVAQQLFGTMFSVPQISVRMEQVTDLHSKVLRNYLQFWNAHRDTLMREKVRMTLCENGYGTAWVENEREKIVQLADCSVPEFDGRAAVIYAVNLTGGENLIVKNTAGVPIRMNIYDCMGECIAKDVVLTARLNEVLAPQGALLVLKRGM